MITSEQLAEMLAEVNVEEVAREADVSVKTIYRLRHQQHSPTLDTVHRLLGAIDRVKARSADAAKAA